MIEEGLLMHAPGASVSLSIGAAVVVPVTLAGEDIIQVRADQSRSRIITPALDKHDVVGLVAGHRDYLLASVTPRVFDGGHIEVARVDGKSTSISRSQERNENSCCGDDSHHQVLHQVDIEVGFTAHITQTQRDLQTSHPFL